VFRSCLKVPAVALAAQRAAFEQEPNPSIERTAHSQLRCLRSAAHVER